jgi:hypothetical protein
VLRVLVSIPFVIAPAIAHAGGGFTVITEESGVAALRDSKPADWWLSGLLLVDLDADGDLDLFMSAHGGGALAGTNDGSGVFTAAAGNYPETEIHLPHDLDEDGLVDLAMTYVDGGGQWWRNASTAGQLDFIATEMTREGNTARNQVLVDVDADGDVDWLRGHNDLSIDLGDGLGSFEADAVVVPVGSGGDLGLLPADLDEDGDPDLVWTTGYYSEGPEQSRVLRNDGGLDFTDVTAGSGVPMDDVTILGVVDVDQDGDADLVGLLDRTLPHRVLLNDGTGHFTELAGAVSGDSGATEYGSWGLGTGADLDNDGIVDLVVNGRNYLKVLRGTGGGHFEYINAAWGIEDVAEASVDGGFSFGDIDDDGDLDLIGWTEIYPERHVALYRNDVAVGNWVRVRAIGLPGRKAAPTAKVAVHDADTGELLHHTQLSLFCKQAQTVYYAHDETERHVGLGPHELVDVSVHFYPSFKLVTVEDVPAGSLVRIGEDGRGDVVPPGGDDGTGSDDASDDGAMTTAGDADAGETASAETSDDEDVDAGATADASSDAGEQTGAEADAEDDGCGCTSASGGMPVWLALPLLFVAAPRRLSPGAAAAGAGRRRGSGSRRRPARSCPAR